MKKIICLLFISFCFAQITKGQVTLDECQEAAKENYPLIKQYNLIELSKEYSLSHIRKGDLPQFTLSGKASYQSESTTMPFEIPGKEKLQLPKDQYQLLLEVSQNIWDGGVNHHKKLQVRAQAAESKRQMDVRMFALRERVNQLFFTLLLLKEQLKQNDLLHENLMRNLNDIKSYQRNGIANSADVDAVKVELLKTKQQKDRLVASRKAYLQMLSLLTGKVIPYSAVLRRPSMLSCSKIKTINRPELHWYNAQQENIEINKKALSSSYLPKLSLFAQGGYGNPGLDMMKDKFRTFGIVGARVTWNFGSLYSLHQDKLKFDSQKQRVESERELFLLNTRMRVAEQQGRIDALEQQMRDDDEIIRMRTNIRKAAEAKVANGTLSVTEMLRELTNENLSIQNKALHQIEYLMQQYRMKQITN